MKKLYKLILFCFLTFSIFSCNSWMNSDDFFNDIDDEVFVANAERINVYVRYAVTTQGTTEPSGSTVFKVGVTSDISCVTNTSYGFHHWAAFSSEFFKTQDQNRNIIYESGAGGYNDKIAKNELGEDIVLFGDKFSPTTTVKILKGRNDIVLVPIVAERAVIDRLSPNINDSNVIKNVPLRYLFTKKMDLSSFNEDTIRITTGDSVMTDVELTSVDITSRYIWKDPTTNTYSPVQSDNGKMITFRLKQGDKLDKEKQVTIYLSNTIKDIDGYELESDQKHYFTTGDKIDALAPIIHALSGGKKASVLEYAKYAEKNATSIYNNISTLSVTDSDFTDYIGQRVGNQLNVYVSAGDIGGEGTGVSTASTDPNGVVMVGVRAANLYDMDGTSIYGSSGSSASIPQNNYVYKSGKSDTTIPTADTLGTGYAFTYDISSLPDGLIAIDVWAIDTVGNSGFTEPYYETYNNGWSTLLVVKDTTPPNIPNVVTESSGTIPGTSEPVSVPYNWYNATSIKSTTIKLASGETVSDVGHDSLKSKSSDIKWAFTVGDDAASWNPNPDETAIWKTPDSAYALTDITPQNQGAVGILMAVKDDLGNIAKQKLDDTVMYDSVSPVMSALSWVDSSGTEVLNVSKENNFADLYLKIPFTEVTSGIREIEIKLGGSSVINSGTKFYYNGLSASDEITSTIASGKAKFDKNYKSGVLYVKGIDIGTSSGDGEKSFNVNLTDAAMNVSPNATTSLVYDKTPPSIEKISFPQIKRIQEFGKTDYKYFVNRDLFNSIEVELTVTEAHSGIQTIDFSVGTIIPTSSSVITVNGESYTNTSFTVTSTGKLTFNNNLITKIKGTSFTIKITNCKLSINGLNLISVSLADFAGNSTDSPKKNATFNSTTDTYTRIAANSAGVPTPTISLSDNGFHKKGGAIIDDDAAPIDNTYTNYEVVNGTVSVALTSTTNDLCELKLTGATFGDDSVFKATVDSTETTLAKNTDYEISADKSTVKFKKAFVSSLELNIKNIVLSGGDGNKNVTLQAISANEAKSSDGSCSITLDTVAPVLQEPCTYAQGTSLWPRNKVGTDDYCVGIDIGGIPYFYTTNDTRDITLNTRDNDLINIDASLKTATDLNSFRFFVNGESKTLSASGKQITYTFDASSTSYTYYAVDAAGNKSNEKEVYVIRDTGINDSLIQTPTITYDTGYSAFKGATFETTTADDSQYYYVSSTPNITVNYPLGAKDNTDSGLAEWGVTTSETGTPTSTTKNTATNPTSISFNLQDYINASSQNTLYLYLKDNVGYEKRIPLKDSGKIISWKNTTAPSFTPKLKVYSTGYDENRYGNLASEPVGDVRYINYYNRSGTDYEISVQYTNDNCLYDTDGDVSHSPSEPTSNYTVKARLHWVSESASAPTVSEIKTATTCVSDWYYSKNNTATRNIGINFLKDNADFAPSTNYKLYLLIENAVGDATVQQVTITDSDGTKEKSILCKDDTAPVINEKTILSPSEIYQKASAGNEFYFKGSTGGNYTFTINKSAITETQSGLYFLKKSGDALPSVTTVTHIAASATNSFTLSAVDQVYNESAPVTIYLYQDNKAPDISDFNVTSADGVSNTDSKYYFNSNNNNTGKSIGVTFKVSDTRDGTNPGSGIKSVSPSSVIYDSSTGKCNLSIPLTGITTEQEYIIGAKDNVGNESASQTIYVIPDGTGPTFGTDAITIPESDNVFFKSGTGYFYRPGSQIKFNVDKNEIKDTDGSGFDKLVYTISESATATGLARNEITLSGTSFTIPTSSSDDSKKYIKLYAVDKVGNESEVPVSFTIIPDKNKPVITNKQFTNIANISFTGNTVFYKAGETPTANITFVMNDEVDGEENNSGLKEANKFFYSDKQILTLSRIPTLVESYPVKDLSTSGNNYFYTVDNVGNLSAPYILTYVADDDVDSLYVAITLAEAAQ